MHANAHRPASQNSVSRRVGNASSDLGPRFCCGIVIAMLLARGCLGALLLASPSPPRAGDIRRVRDELGDVGEASSSSSKMYACDDSWKKR